MVQVIGILLTIILVAASLYLVVAPLMSGKVPFSSGFKKEQPSKEALKEVVFTTLNELELEYQMGKVTEEDYEVLKRKHEKEAAELMEIKEISAGMNNEEIDAAMMDEIEKEIKEELMRRKGGK